MTLQEALEAASWHHDMYVSRTVSDDAQTAIPWPALKIIVNAYRSGDLVPLPEVEEARLAALEEAAKVVERGDWRDGTASRSERRIAQAIRDLANKGKV